MEKKQQRPSWRRKKYTWTEPQLLDLEECYLAGMPWRDMGQRFGCDNAAMLYQLKKRGVKPNRQRGETRRGVTIKLLIDVDPQGRLKVRPA